MAHMRGLEHTKGASNSVLHCLSIAEGPYLANYEGTEAVQLAVKHIVSEMGYVSDTLVSPEAFVSAMKVYTKGAWESECIDMDAGSLFRSARNAINSGRWTIGTVQEMVCSGCGLITSVDHDREELYVPVSTCINLEDYIAQLSAVETVSYRCGRCTVCEHRTRMLVKEMPELLCLQIQRVHFVDGVPEKPKDYVTCPYVIDCGSLVVREPNVPMIQLEYNLYGVIVHIGPGPCEGTYECYVKAADIWYKIAEDKIAQCPEGPTGLSALGGSCVVLYKRT